LDELDLAAPQGNASDLISWSDAGGGSFDYTVESQLASTYAYGSVTGIPTVRAHTTEMFAYAAITSLDIEPIDDLYEKGSFGNHDSVLAWRVFKSFYTSSTSTNDNDRSTKLGGLEQPTWPPTLTPTDAGLYSTYKNYAVINEIAILKWDVTGGLEFVDSVGFGEFFMGED
jgi:hypothetical protein